MPTGKLLYTTLSQNNANTNIMYRFEAHPHVNGVPGSSARKVGSRDAALAEYAAAYDSGNIFRR